MKAGYIYIPLEADIALSMFFCKVIARRIRLGWWIRTQTGENDAIKKGKSEEN